MIRFLWRWVKRGVLAVLILLLAVIAPIGYNELACQSEVQADAYTPILPSEHHRPESRTYLTYPEWHIVHAYDDYAKVIETGDPHQYGFLRSIFGFWSSLCDLSRVSGAYGGFPFETKQMVYVIGASFTVEMLAKAAYEETFGRIATLIRGDEHSALDRLSAEQARGYATFLQQVPWYKWDFLGDARALDVTATDALRDRERQFALGIEYRVKSGYAGVIAGAVEGVGGDALTLRMIVDAHNAPSNEAVTVIGKRPEGVELETIRYRALTRILLEMAAQGVNFVEIAGNDDIMLTVLSEQAAMEGAQSSMQRQGYRDYRHLVGVKVGDLAETLRKYANTGILVEHIHDY